MNELFINTPIFDIPPTNYDLEDYRGYAELNVSSDSAKRNNSSGWSKISNMIFNSKDKRMEYIKNYDQIKERTESKGKVPFLYKIKRKIIEEENIPTHSRKSKTRKSLHKTGLRNSVDHNSHINIKVNMKQETMTTDSQNYNSCTNKMNKKVIFDRNMLKNSKTISRIARPHTAVSPK